jgi:archaellum biogenesis protein FlaJ (TadC family)
MSTIGSKLNVGEAANYISIGTIRFGFIRISSDFLRNYSLLTLAIASIFGGLIIGLLQEGKENAGIKFIPILLSLNMAIYFTIKIVLSSVMGSLTPTAVLPI